MIDVQYQQGRIFRAFRSDMRDLQRDIHSRASLIVRFQEETAIQHGKSRFYRSGRGLLSLFERQLEEGNKLLYEITFLRFYMIFGEYGTGKRGAATGPPAPLGYTYGQKPGMAARRFSRIAVGRARPQVDKMAKERVRRYALNATVS